MTRPRFLTLTDLDGVTVCFNLDHVRLVVLKHNGIAPPEPGQRPYVPLVNVLTTQETVWENLRVPTAGGLLTPETAMQAMAEFFRKLEEG